MSVNVKAESIAWLNAIFSEKGVSGVGVADAIGMDRGNFNKSVNGKVNFTLKNLSLMSEYLGVSLDELLTRYRPDLKVAADGGAKLVGFVDENFRIKFNKSEKTIPAFGLSQCLAVQIKAPNGGLSGMDGALIFYKEAKKSPENLVGVMSIVAIEGGEVVLGVLKKGYEKGTFNVLDFAGRLIEEDLKVDFGQQIALIKI